MLRHRGDAQEQPRQGLRLAVCRGYQGRREGLGRRDRGLRYVVVSNTVCEMADLDIMNPRLQAAARGVFERLDTGAAA